jgi:hypothetical protein
MGDSKAPKLEAYNGAKSLVLPDILVAGNGGLIWVEVKWKDHAEFTHITQRLETGLNRRLWNQYVSVSQQTSVSIWLFFLHKKEGELRGGDIEELSSVSRVYDGPKMGPDGMVFFPWDSLQILDTYDNVIKSTPCIPPPT